MVMKFGSSRLLGRFSKVVMKMRSGSVETLSKKLVKYFVLSLMNYLQVQSLAIKLSLKILLFPLNTLFSIIYVPQPILFACS